MFVTQPSRWYITSDMWYQRSLCLRSVKGWQNFSQKLKINAGSLAKGVTTSKPLFHKSFVRLHIWNLFSPPPPPPPRPHPTRKSFSFCRRESRVDGSTTASVTQEKPPIQTHPSARLHAFFVWQSSRRHVTQFWMSSPGRTHPQEASAHWELSQGSSFPQFCTGSRFAFRWMWFLKAPAWAKF